MMFYMDISFLLSIKFSVAQNAHGNITSFALLYSLRNVFAYTMLLIFTYTFSIKCCLILSDNIVRFSDYIRL